MRSASTRRFLDVEGLASERAVLAGRLESGSMPRLLEVVAAAPGAITYRIEFARDASGRPRMTGRVEATLPLVCQRCLDGLDLRLDARFESLVLGSDRGEMDGQDVVVCPNRRLALESVVEDELLLALPDAPVHAHGSCEAPRVRDPDGRLPSPRSTHPFSALHALRSRHGRERSG